MLTYFAFRTVPHQELYKSALASAPKCHPKGLWPHLRTITPPCAAQWGCVSRALTLPFTADKSIEQNGIFLPTLIGITLNVVEGKIHYPCQNFTKDIRSYIYNTLGCSSASSHAKNTKGGHRPKKSSYAGQAKNQKSQRQTWSSSPALQVLHAWLTILLLLIFSSEL